jgi:hypothetical protein
VTTYFTTDPTARVSFWDNQVELTVTSDGLEIPASHVADVLVEQGVLRVGDGTKDTAKAPVYDPAKDESLVYAASLEATQAPAPDPAPFTPGPAPAPEVQSASSSGDTPASQPSGPDAPQKETRT